MEFLTTRREQRGYFASVPARNRFLAATREQALERLAIQSGVVSDAIATVNNFPWIYTNAGVSAEAAAHWAFVAYPELRVEDEY